MARAIQAPVWVRSDGSGEFGERVGDAPMPTDFAPEFVVAAPNVLHERVTAHDHAGTVVAFESAHRSEAGFEPAVVGFETTSKARSRRLMLKV